MQDTPVTVNEAVQAYYANILEMAEDKNAGQILSRRTPPGHNTLKVRRCNLSNLADYCEANGIKHVDQLDEHHVRAMIRERVAMIKPNGGNLEPARSSVNNVRDTYRQFIKYCSVRGWITFQRAGEITCKIKTLPPTVTPALIVDEHNWPEVFDMAAKRHLVDRVFLELGYTLLVRDSEIARLTWNDFDFRKMEVTLRRDKGADMLIMPITEELNETLEEWRTWLELHIGPIEKTWHVVAPRERKTGFVYRKVFPGWPVNPNKMYGKDTGLRVIKWMLTQLGYSKDEQVRQGTHLLRRSGAANLYEKGYDINLIREALGHADLATTLHYIRRGVNLDKVKDMLNRPIKKAKALAQVEEEEKSLSLGVTNSAEQLGDLISLMTPDELAVLLARQREKLLSR